MFLKQDFFTIKIYNFFKNAFCLTHKGVPLLGVLDMVLSLVILIN